tara:strand:+ start:275 stop:394 length:120 start_codon:yes stop_codon:yes gene_type:complete
MTLLTLEEFKEWADEYPELASHVHIVETCENEDDQMPDY